MNSSAFGRIHRVYTLPLTNTAAASASAANAVKFGIGMVRLVASQDCWVEYRTGAPPVANGSTPSGFFLPAGHVETVRVDAGEIVSAITDTAATGSLNVAELD